MRSRLLASALGALALTVSSARAIIVFGADESGNLVNPGIGSAWDSIVSVAKPTQNFNATAIYLGSNVFLTAGHVDAVVSGTAVKINGTNYTLDTSFYGDGIIFGTDLPGVTDDPDFKLFKVVEPVALTGVTLNTDAIDDLNNDGYLIGYGVGKGTEVVGEGWNWGAVETTSAKRWGESVTLNSTVAVSSPPYAYDALATPFFTGYGADVGSGTLGDSGGALMQFIDGQWVLSGMITAVSVGGSSFYNRLPGGTQDLTAYVRISDYASAINSVIPEPTSAGLVILGSVFIGVARRGRKA